MAQAYFSTGELEAPDSFPILTLLLVSNSRWESAGWLEVVAVGEGQWAVA